MRTFEIILLVVITILPFTKRKLAGYFPAKYLCIFPAAILVLHLVIEGYRWQMIPAYILTGILIWRMLAMDTSRQVRLTIPRLIGFLIIFLLLITGWILPLILPVFSLPEPRGPYTVGTETVYLKTEMPETITSDPADSRELLYKIWYPSSGSPADANPEPYVDAGSRAGFAMKYGLPPSALNYLDHVKTYVYPGIPVAVGPFPVLIFSHGYGSKATGYYALLSELASQGYVIINMNHTYESLGVTFPDGRITFFDYAYQEEIAAGAMEVIEPVIAAFRDGLPYENRHPIIRKAAQEYFEGRIQDRWAQDMLYTLNMLENWNSEGILKGKLDLDRIGVIGHSVGGGTAGNVAMRDRRVKAAVNLDGIQWGKKIDTVYQVPYLYLSADWPAEHEDINAHVYINKSTDYFYETKLLESGHPNFMDIPFMIPVNQLAGTGTIDPYHGMEIVTTLVTTFFDRHLKGDADADPVKIGEQYDALQMKVYVGDSVN